MDECFGWGVFQHPCMLPCMFCVYRYMCLLLWLHHVCLREQIHMSVVLAASCMFCVYIYVCVVMAALCMFMCTDMYESE